MGCTVGRFDAAVIDNCYATGTVTSDALSLTDWTNAGGLAGRGYQSKIQNSWANVTVTAKGYRNGGLVGQMWDDGADVSQIVSSFSLGNVVGGSTYTGGLVGMMNGGIVRNSYARGDVTRSSGATNTSFGAFLGGWYDDQPEVHTSYSTGNVYYAGTSAPTDKGFSGGSIADDTNFFDSEASNQSSAVGATAKTTTQMKTVSTFIGAGWDFGSVWGIESGVNDGYPRFLTSNERTLSYVAGTGGTISGTTFQIVSSGSGGTAVAAVPNMGYHFVDWSDHSTNNPRTDTNVRGNISVSAIFVDSSAPAISGASATPTDGSANIEWTTNEASTSRVLYGLTSSLGFATVKDGTLVENHSVNLDSLHACARYFVRIVSEDASHNATTSSIFTFSTLGCDTSSIENGGEEFVSSSGGTVSVNTNKGAASLTIPSDFYSSGGTSKEATFQINTLDTASSSSEPSGTNLVDDNLFELLAVSDNDEKITSFDKGITFVVRYGSDVGSSFEEGTLDVYRYSGGEWIKQSCALDTAAHTLTCALSHFSTYGVFGEEPQSDTAEDTSSSPNDNGMEEIKDEEEKPKKADVNSWTASLYNTLVSPESCRERVKLVIDGHDFDKHAQVRIGGKKALRTERKSSQKIVASFCLADLLEVKTERKRSVSVINPDTEADKANKKIDLDQLGFEDVHEDIKGEPAIAQSSSVEMPASKSDPVNIPSFSGEGKPNTCSYTVEEGDSLWSIAKQVYEDATAYPLIIRENKERYPDILGGALHIGQSLVFGCDDHSNARQEDTKMASPDQGNVTTQANNDPENRKDAHWRNPLSWF